jgi:hypothetical protein
MHVSSCANRLRRMLRLPVIAAALILPGVALAQPAGDADKCQPAAGLTSPARSFPARASSPALLAAADEVIE